MHGCHFRKIFTRSLANVQPADVVAEIVFQGRKELEKRKGRQIDMFPAGTTDSMDFWDQP